MVAMYPILCYYNSIDGRVLPFIFSVRKFLQSVVHPPQASFDLCEILAQAPITPTGQESKGGANGK
jgi:hypothetical protein